MSAYDRWLEAPYQRRAAEDERWERACDDLYDESWEEVQSYLDGAKLRDEMESYFEAIVNRNEPWNWPSPQTPWCEIREMAKPDEQRRLDELLQEAAEGLIQWENENGGY